MEKELLEFVLSEELLAHFDIIEVRQLQGSYVINNMNVNNLIFV